MGEIPRPQICRHQAVRAGRRRIDDSGLGSRDQIWRRRPGRLDRDGNGASRPPQRPRQRDGQALSRDLLGIRRRVRQPGGCRRIGRRQISSRHLVRSRVRRHQGPSLAGPQSQSSRSGRSGRARQGEGAAGRPRRPRRRPGAAGAAPRRRRFRRPGHRRRMSRLLGHSRLLDRRLPPLHHQQPGRLHHQPAIRPLVALSVGRRQGDPGADPPRQRRRSRGGDLLLQARHRISPALQPRYRHRHVVLPPLRP